MKNWIILQGDFVLILFFTFYYVLLYYCKDSVQKFELKFENKFNNNIELVEETIFLSLFFSNLTIDTLWD